MGALKKLVSLSKLHYVFPIVCLCFIPLVVSYVNYKLVYRIPVGNIPNGDRRFHEQFRVGRLGGVEDSSKSGSGWDVREDGEAVYLKLELPGIGKDDVKITLEKNSLVIKGGPEDNLGFSGGMEIPTNCCFLDSITAIMKNGVLKVTVPKAKDDNEMAVSNYVKHITVD